VFNFVLNPRVVPVSWVLLDPGLFPELAELCFVDFCWFEVFESLLWMLNAKLATMALSTGAKLGFGLRERLGTVLVSLVVVTTLDCLLFGCKEFVFLVLFMFLIIFLTLCIFAIFGTLVGLVVVPVLVQGRMRAG